MAQITAAEVSKLRGITGAGMMDCKKALEEAGSDFEKAIEIIRKKGQAIANKRADREASEGVSLSKVNSEGTYGVMIALNCETDFVAKNVDFVKFATVILDKALETKPADLDSLKKLTINGKSIEDLIIEQIGVIGEKIELAYFDSISAGQVVAYIHHGNKLSTLVGLSKAVKIEVGKDVAMQVAAMSPVAIDKDDVSAKMIEQEKEIGREQARKEGKPENMIEKIAEGKLNKFFKESTLLNQEYTKDNKVTIKQFLQAVDKDLTVTAFKRYALNV